MLDIVETVVDKELQFGDDAQLVTCACAQLVAYLRGVVIDVVADLLRTFAGEDAEVAAADAHIGADAADADADQHSVGGLCLALEDVAQFFLNEASYFILTCCFHIVIHGLRP